MKRITYRNKDGILVKGVAFNIILNNRGYYLVDLIVYADGLIDCLGSIDIEKLKEHLDSGKLTRELPKESGLFIPYIGSVWTANALSPGYDNAQFLKIIGDTIKELNSEPDIKKQCIQRFKQYLIEPNDSNFENLKNDFLRIPENERALFEMVDHKDPLIELMRTEKPLTREKREYILNDYFDGEWIEMK